MEVEQRENTKDNESLILIFVKHPIPGQVKTRLAKSIGNERAAEVYRKLLSFTKEQVEQLSADKVVFYGNVLPEKDLWAEARYLRKLQQGQTLGDRMKAAFRWGFQQEYKKIVIIGSDCSQLTPSILAEAFQILDQHEVAIGPAKDGGYYLLGMKQEIPQLFAKKAWSTDSVLSTTIKDLEDLHLSYQLLPELSDIDTVGDLKGTFLESFMDIQANPSV